MICTGRGNGTGDHCCYLNGQRCQFLSDNVDGRRYSCSLRAELGSWEAVHADPLYINHVQPFFTSLGFRQDGTPIIESCGSWGPGSGQCCYAETNVGVT